jgi:hypothetical protein
MSFKPNDDLNGFPCKSSPRFNVQLQPAGTPLQIQFCTGFLASGRRALDIPGLLLPEKFPVIPVWTQGLAIKGGLESISGSLV